MKIGFILAGLIFLANPYVHIIDIFPDLIGYALILHGLSKLSDLERNLLSAKKNMQKLMWLSAGRRACLLILPIFDETLYLLFTFVFGIFEVIWLLPAMIDLFHGISFLEERYTKHRTRHTKGAEPRFGGVMDKTDFAEGRVYFEVYPKTRENEEYPADEEFVFLPSGKVTVCAAYEGFAAKDETQTPYFYESAEARVMSVIFVIVRALCAIIPELTAIMSVGDSYVHANPVNEYAGLRYLLEGALAAVAGVVGIIWLVRMVKYFRVFMHDKPFLATLSEKYEAEIVPNKALWVKRGTLSFCLYSTIALTFLTCIRLSLGNIVNTDGKLLFTLDAGYLIPEFLFGLMMFFAFRRIRTYHGAWQKGAKLSLAFMGVSFVSYSLLLAVSIRFGRLFRPYEEKGYLLLFFLYLAIFVASMALFVMVCREKKHAYASLVGALSMVLAPDDNDYAKKRREHTAAEFAKKLREIDILAVIYAVFSVLCMAVIPLAEEYTLCGLSWLFRSALCAYLIFRSVLLTDKLQHELEKVID